MTKSQICIVMFALAPAISVYGLAVSPWHHEQPELAVNPIVIPGSAPIVYNISTFTREREMYGYNPRFFPNLVTFDCNNRPHIYVSVFESPGDNSTTYPYYKNSASKAYIQTLDSKGVWKVLPVDDMIRAQFPGWTGNLYGGVANCNERVVFDADGDMYWTVHRTNPSSTLLFHSRDLINWQAYNVGSYRWRLELNDSFNNLHLPPTLVYDDGDNGIWMVAPGKNANGTLNNTNAVNIIPGASKYYLAPAHSGGGNSVVTVGNKSHIVFLSTTPSSYIPKGTDQFYASFDRDTRIASAPVCLGTTLSCSGPGGDVHNGPIITLDGQNRLHVMLGSHSRPFKYTNSINGVSWSSPVEVRNSQTIYDTYVGMVTDHNNTMHMVARMTESEGLASEGVGMLHYMRKRTTDSKWVDCGALIKPVRVGYCGFYHKLTIDRLGRLFLAYFYYADWLSEAERTEYIQKWPNDPDPNVEMRAHDSVILMSDNGGNSWRIATTNDFLVGMRLTPLQPRITPQQKVLDSGDMAEFTVTGVDKAYSFSWRRSADSSSNTPEDDVQVGGNSNTLKIYNVQKNHEGYYYCIVSNVYGDAYNSDTAALIVKRLVSRWDFEDNLVDSVGGYNGTRVNTPVFETGIVGSKALRFFGNVGDSVCVPYTNEHNLRTFTISAWVKAENDYSWRGIISTRKNQDSLSKGYLFYAANNNIWTYWTGTGGGTWNVVNGPGIINGQWTLLTASYDDSIKTMKLYVNGSLYSYAIVDNFSINDTYGLLIGGAYSNSGTVVGYPFTGLIDDARYYSYVLDAVEIAHLYADATQQPVCVELPKFDFDGNCVVDFTDLNVLLSSWLENNFVLPQ